MKGKSNRNIKIIISAVAMFLFFFVMIDVFVNNTTSYDKWAADVIVDGLRNDNMTIVMKSITFLGSVYTIAIGLISMFMIDKDKRNVAVASITIFAAFLLNNLLKIIIQRPRPTSYSLINETGFSFPSGHSMVSTAFYGFLMYLVYKNVKNKKKRILMMSLLLFIIISICISRIYLGVHYLSDTIAGFCLSVAYLMVFLSLTYKFVYKEEEKYERRKARKASS